MAAHLTEPGRWHGLLSVVLQGARRLLSWRPGRYEVAEEPQDSRQYELAAQALEPEHVHHSRYSPQELDACIEDSIRTGSVDLDDALRDSGSGDFDPGKSRLSLRRPRLKPSPAEPAAGEARAFGGDLYPTTAHTTGEDVHYVKVSTWSNGGTPGKEPSR